VAALRRIDDPPYGAMYVATVWSVEILSEKNSSQISRKPEA
jgi:hypothetical protein